jgi:cell division protein FtsL
MFGRGCVMLRFVNICLILGLVVLATVIYQVKYEARSLDEKIVILQRQIEAERDSLAVARAEWSLLNRPERIERLAEKYLELQPAHPQQIVVVGEVTGTDFERVRSLAQAAKTGDTPTASFKPGAH